MTRNNDYGAHHIKVNIFRVFRVMHTVLYSMILKNLIVNWIIDYSNNEILFIFIYNSFY